MLSSSSECLNNFICIWFLKTIYNICWQYNWQFYFFLGKDNTKDESKKQEESNDEAELPEQYLRHHSSMERRIPSEDMLKSYGHVTATGGTVKPRYKEVGYNKTLL